MIEAYWMFLGLPLSRLTGAWVDRVSWPVSEINLWLGLLCCSLGPLAWKAAWPWWGRMMLGFGILLLVIQGFSQGATPWDFVPTVFRDRPSERIKTSEVQGESFNAWFAEAQHSVKNPVGDFYQNASEQPDLRDVHVALGAVLAELNYPQGREVRAIKTMRGLSRLLGLAYGGPAYHDVVTGEVAMASALDYPSTKMWRWSTVVHECAHAQGFTREMDAEILTYLALKKMGKMGQFCALGLALGKTQLKVDWPEFIRAEQCEVQAQRKALHQPGVDMLRKWSRIVNIQNSGQKYGALAEGQSLPPRDHEFFRVVLGVK